MMRTILLLWLFVLLSSEKAKCDNGFALKFKVVHEAILTCANKGTNDLQVNFRLSKKDRNHMSMKGNLTFKVPFDNNVAVHVKLQIWGNGGWKSGSGVDFAREDGCTAFQRVLGPVWIALTKEIKTSPDCPLKPGIYLIENFDAANWDNLAIPGAPINKYKLTVNFLKSGTKILLGCYSSIFNVLRKK
ncbi:uncharacterized protein LOC106663758 [Cimex lectularius]|uniref:MD-2-related lipid-recognition domain-containing protein n=1 Tax=Cimex lectularius TaxID=79782 RepID=A0A8I6RDY4_CIMLE|nr:uncharacterized protein LOC106663758 [Cimex lectularius]